MKKIIFFVLLGISTTILNAFQTDGWWFMGYTQTGLYGNHAKSLEDTGLIKVKNLEGFQTGFSVIALFDNSIILGTSFRYVEKGWLTESENILYTVKDSYIDGILKGGYDISSSSKLFYPYLGISVSKFLNSEVPTKYRNDPLLSLLFGLDINFIEKFIICLSYDIGITNVVINEDAKLNSLNIGIGRRF